MLFHAQPGLDMKRTLLAQIIFLWVSFHAALAINAPTGLVGRMGDQSIVLHWDRNTDSNLGGYRVYRSLNSAGPFTPLQAITNSLTSPGYCDLTVSDGQTNYYQVTAVTTSLQESSPSSTLAAVANPFVSNDAFLDYVQEVNFDYFWYEANPANGLVPDRSAVGSACSIASVGFGLSAIGIAVDHGWLLRTQGVTRVLATLNTFLNGPQGPGTTGIIGYNGWFYHFLDMNAAVRSGSSELSSIDTALLLGGILYAKQYFNGASADETSIRAAADGIFNRVNWTWMAQGTDTVAMGWQPTTGFSGFGNWVGYNEGMILYCLGLGTTTNPLPASAWGKWTNGYNWGTYYGQTFVPFPPLFGHEYSHCWIDFRHVADVYMNGHSSSYFENSRRAALAQVTYAIQNPNHAVAYSSNVWGLTACDDPTNGYAVHGIPPGGFDNGTIAPTASGGAMSFTPQNSLPTLLYFYSHYRPRIWTAYGFRDAFNIGAQWYDTDELGIDQGPIVIMIENYRTQSVWRFFMQNAEVQRGLQRAGFVSLPSVPLTLQPVPAQGAVNVVWSATAGRFYQVEYSSNLSTWAVAPGLVQATNSGTFDWLDTGPPATFSLPASAPQRFYRVFELGSSNSAALVAEGPLARRALANGARDL